MQKTAECRSRCLLLQIVQFDTGSIFSLFRICFLFVVAHDLLISGVGDSVLTGRSQTQFRGQLVPLTDTLTREVWCLSLVTHWSIEDLSSVSLGAARQSDSEGVVSKRNRRNLLLSLLSTVPKMHTLNNFGRCLLLLCWLPVLVPERSAIGGGPVSVGVVS